MLTKAAARYVQAAEKYALRDQGSLSRKKLKEALLLLTDADLHMQGRTDNCSSAQTRKILLHKAKIIAMSMATMKKETNDFKSAYRRARSLLQQGAKMWGGRYSFEKEMGSEAFEPLLTMMKSNMSLFNDIVIAKAVPPASTKRKAQTYGEASSSGERKKKKRKKERSKRRVDL